jgi:hypothetical protein
VSCARQSLRRISIGSSDSRGQPEQRATRLRIAEALNDGHNHRETNHLHLIAACPDALDAVIAGSRRRHP